MYQNRTPEDNPQMITHFIQLMSHRGRPAACAYHELVLQSIALTPTLAPAILVLLLVRFMLTTVLL